MNKVFEQVESEAVETKVYREIPKQEASDTALVWYECVDVSQQYTKRGHKPSGIDAIPLLNVLRHPENEGARVVNYDGREFIVKAGALVPVDKRKKNENGA